MKKTVILLIASLIIAGTSGGCGMNKAEPLMFNPPPWQDGEVSEYDLLDSMDQPAGTATWTWKKTANGWEQQYVLSLADREDTSLVRTGEDLFPLYSLVYRAGAEYEADFGDEVVTIDITAADGVVSSQEVRRSANMLDNSQLLQVQRAMPLSEGYRTGYKNLVTASGQTVNMSSEVVGTDTITVPAGTFNTWHVEMHIGSAIQDAWYQVDAPHLLVKYHNRAAGSKFVMRAAP